MNAQRRFRTGIGGICLGNGLLAVSFFLDQSLIRLVRMAVLVGAALGILGTIMILYASFSDPGQFEFTTERRVPTAVLIAGLVTILAGLTNLARVFPG